jgi:hypothetical protein
MGSDLQNQQTAIIEHVSQGADKQLVPMPFSFLARFSNSFSVKASFCNPNGD